MGRPKKQRHQVSTVVREVGETLVSSPFQLNLLSRLVGIFSSSSDRVTRSSVRRIEVEPNVPTPIFQQAERTYTRRRRLLNESKAPKFLEQGCTFKISRRLSSKRDMKKSIEESIPVTGASVLQSNENLSSEEGNWFYLEGLMLRQVVQKRFLQNLWPRSMFQKAHKSKERSKRLSYKGKHQWNEMILLL